ncbi:hypothetical protein DUNSADRAFT_15096, partial [Dunaliella salina]
PSALCTQLCCICLPSTCVLCLQAPDRFVSRAAQATETPTAKETVTKFYTAYNTGDSDTIAACMAEDVNYHDMIHPEPFKGRNEVVEYMKKVREEVPSDLQFVIEEIAGEENKCGIRW